MVASRTARQLTIAKLGLPIVGAMASQHVMSLVDVAMVGTLGTKALAAAGLGAFVTFVAQACMMGLESGVQGDCGPAERGTSTG